MKDINMDGKKVAVIGSRTFNDRDRLFEVLDKNKARIKLIVSGGARGADTLATEWAQERGIPYLVFPAKWKTDDGTHDKGAGFRRNRLIIQYSDVVIAFHDGESRGTQHSLDTAKSLNKPVRVIKFTPTPEPEPETVEATDSGPTVKVSSLD
jgi:predicted Rossmann fold nucleotide-binding protein DprA/Smf involved in DNA uptake